MWRVRDHRHGPKPTVRAPDLDATAPADPGEQAEKPRSHESFLEPDDADARDRR
jgi:hypothetical protein